QGLDRCGEPRRDPGQPSAFPCAAAAPRPVPDLRALGSIAWNLSNPDGTRADYAGLPRWTGGRTLQPTELLLPGCPAGRRHPRPDRGQDLAGALRSGGNSGSSVSGAARAATGTRPAGRSAPPRPDPGDASTVLPRADR